MAEAHVSGDLPLSQDDAWKLLSDLSGFEQWLTIHDSWKSEIPELAVGARVTEQLTVMGMTNVIEWTIDDYAPPVSLKISGAGLAGAQIAFTLSVAPSGTNSTVTIDAEFTGQMMVGAIGDAVQKNATVELEKSLTRLQELAG
jgi:carbon monoxide dehydrogenase subunit G